MRYQQTIRATVNGSEVVHTIPNRLTLAEFLRDWLGLTGTKVSCGMQVCGACTVLIDDVPVSSCTYLAVDIDGAEVLTIEGLAAGEELHPLQQAFIEKFALQCGYCTPGMIMQGVALLEENPDPTPEDIQDYFDGNICRCTGYRPILDAVLTTAESLKETGRA